MKFPRRQFLRLVGAVAAVPALPRAASTLDFPTLPARRIGVLMGLPATDSEAPIRVAALLQRLQELGWTDRRNVRIDYRLGDSNTMKTVAAALVALAPDILVVNGTSGLQALQQATRTIPIVFVNVIDPVGQGFIMSLEHPGGNVTGLSTIESEMGRKWLQLLKEIAPHVTTVAVIGATTLGGGVGIETAIYAAAPSLGVKLVSASPRVPSDFDHVINTLDRHNAGLLLLPGPLTLINREGIVALATRARLPAIYPYRFYVTGGGLMSYGVDTAEAYRRAAEYVDRILKGEKPADLPIQRATNFELVINLQTAKTLGIEVPSTLLAQADEVIE
jgi:putative ABC transport system substrate-binding protein